MRAPDPVRHRGAADRVAEAQHQARRGFGFVAVFALFAPVVALLPRRTGTWLPLHLFLVGALLLAISTATQYLAVTWSASPAPPRWAAAAQRWTLALGAAGVALGRERDLTWLCGLGGVLVVVALAGLGALLVGIRRNAVTPRFRPAIDAYLAAVVAGLVGAGLGTALAVGEVAADRVAAVRQGHLTVNLLGLVGLVIAGTVPYFTATQARMKMSSRATASRIRAVLTALALAVALAAAGYLLGHPGVAALGLVAYAGGLVGVVRLLPVVGRRQLDWAGPRLVQLGSGLIWWVATVLVLAGQAATGRGDGGPVVRALVLGGYAQVLVASLAYLGPVLRGGGHRHLSAGFALTRSWWSVGFGNLAGLAALLDRPGLLGAVLAGWTVDLAVRGIRLVATAPPPEARAEPPTELPGTPAGAVTAAGRGPGR